MNGSAQSGPSSPLQGDLIKIIPTGTPGGLAPGSLELIKFTIEVNRHRVERRRERVSGKTQEECMSLLTLIPQGSAESAGSAWLSKK